MSVSKKARYVASITNRTTIFGIMGGLSNSVGVLAANQSAIRNKASNQQVIPLKPVPGLNYMKGNNPMGRIMLSRNPQCSGGVGRTSGGGFAGCSPANNVSASFLAGGGATGNFQMVALPFGGGSGNLGAVTPAIIAIFPGLSAGYFIGNPAPTAWFSLQAVDNIASLVVSGQTLTTGTVTISGVTDSTYGPYTFELNEATSVDDTVAGFRAFQWDPAPGSPAALISGHTYRIITSF